MRTLGAFVFTAFLCLTAGAMAASTIPPLPSPNHAPMLRDAKLVCGKVEGKLRCKNVKDGTIGIEIDDGKKKTKPGDMNGENGGAAEAGGAGGGGGAEAGGGGGAGAGGGGTETDTEESGCPEGYKTLDPPSKYGPCEPPEGLPNAAYKVCPTGAKPVPPHNAPPSCECTAPLVYGDFGNKCVAAAGGNAGVGGGGGDAGAGGGGGGGN